MKKLLFVLMYILVLIGCGSPNSYFDEHGNLEEKYVHEMQREWCKYNAGREFVTTQCDDLT